MVEPGDRTILGFRGGIPQRNPGDCSQFRIASMLDADVSLSRLTGLKILTPGVCTPVETPPSLPRTTIHHVLFTLYRIIPTHA